LLDLAAYLDVPIRFFAVATLQKVAPLFPASERVERVLGVGSVARPSAFLASSGGKELGYFRGQGVTLALFGSGDAHGLD
ncbi:MAG: cobalamin biosynthesis protein, partial [Candidatus Caldatribacteriaceae bacterium]